MNILQAPLQLPICLEELQVDEFPIYLNELHIDGCQQMRSVQGLAQLTKLLETLVSLKWL